MKKKNWIKRSIALALCAVMLGTSSPAQSLAAADLGMGTEQEAQLPDEEPADIIETEPDEEMSVEPEVSEVPEMPVDADLPSPEPEKSETPAETQPAPTVEATARPARDLTQETSELKLSVEKISYCSKQGEENAVVVDEGQADLSKIDVKEQKELKLQIGFQVLGAAGERELQKGDTFTLTIPDALPLKAVETPAQISKDDTVFGTFTVQEQNVKVTFTDAVKDLEHVAASFTVQVDISRLTLKEEENTNVQIGLPGGRKVTVLLPMAKKEVTETPAASDTKKQEGDTTLTPAPASKTEETPQAEAGLKREKASKAKDKKTFEEFPEIVESAQEADVLVTEPGIAIATLTKQWVDNNNANGKRPDINAFKNALEIQYLVGGGEWQTLSDENKGEIGLEAIPAISVDMEQGTGYWKCKVSDLPASHGGNNISYRLVEKDQGVDGYRKEESQSVSGDLVTNYETKDVTIYLEFMAGAMVKDNSLTKKYIEEHILPNITLFRKTGDQGTDLTPVSDPGTPQIAQAGDADSKIVQYTLTYPGLDAYDSENDALVYSGVVNDNKIDVGSEGDYAGDYLKAEYNNVEVPNHGTETDRAYDGGVLRLTLMGETYYTATKEWLDHGEKDGRPDATLYLWRYSDRDGYDFKSAAQVQDAVSNQVVTQELQGKALPEGTDSETINFPDGTGTAMTLPKYDTDGYRYEYIAREKLTGDNAGNYEQVFGQVTVDNAGNESVVDERPYSDARKSGDKSLYNGGVLSNRRKGTVPLKVTKTWYAAAFQSQLMDVKVKVQLQGRYQGATAESDWHDVGNPVLLENFLAETLSKTYEGSAAQYDALGRELEYRWVEKEITYTKSGQIETTTVDNDGHFKLWLMDPLENKKKDIEFQSMVKDGSTTGDYALENRLAAEVEYKVIKKWGNGEGGYFKGDEDFLKGATVTFSVTQNGKPYTDENANASGKYEIKYDAAAADSGYWVKTLMLPEYDRDGHLYTYRFEEVQITGAKSPDGKGVWDFDHMEYDMVHHKVTLVNVVKGPGLSFVVNKEWLDDGDLLHRYNVHVNIYRKETGANNGAYVTTAVLTQNGSWTAQVGISGVVPETTKAAWIAETQADGFNVMDHYYIKEVAITDGAYDTGIPTTEEEWSAYRDAGEEKRPKEIEGVEHKYRVTYAADSFTVTNRRIGTVDLLAEKQWVDGENQDSSRVNGLELQVVTTDHKDDVVLDYDANSITIKDNTGLPVETFSGLTLKSTVEKEPTIENYTYNDRADVAKTEPYTNIFKKLPKYAADGSVIHYSLVETGALEALKDNDYAISITQDSYNYTQAGGQYSSDVQKMTVTNKRVGTKAVAFAKKWVDTYAYTNGKRPDIFLTLYRRGGDTGTLELVEPYPDRDWYYLENNNNYGYCEFPGLAKYDASGAKYIYYATEESTANAKANDYTDVYYKGTVLKSDQASASLSDAKQSGDGTLWYLQEGQAGPKGKGGSDADGYFENRLESAVKLTCIKTWKNIPEGFRNKDLPSVKISALRYETNDDGTKDLNKPAMTAVDGKSYNLADAADSTTWRFDVDTYATGKTDDPLNDTPLQRYDNSGKLYLYELTELGVDIQGADSTSPTESGDGSVSIGGVPIYTIQNPSKDADTWKLTNVFDNGKGENRGSLTVKKTWEREEGITGPYPSVEFTLYRTYPTGAGVSPEKVAAKTLNSNTYTGNEPKVDDTGVGSVTFDGLAIYAPNGEPYSYYVEETPVDGYTTETDGSPAGNQRQSKSVPLTKNTATTFTKAAYGFLGHVAALTGGTNTLTRFSLQKTAKSSDGTSLPFGSSAPADPSNPDAGAGAVLPLSPIVLGVYRLDSPGVKVAEWTMDTDGTITAKVSKDGTGSDTSWVNMVADSTDISGLPVGTYILKEESAPKGYAKAGNLTFTIGDDGKLTSVAAGTVSNDGQMLTMTDEITKISIQKTGEGADSTGLAGATLSLTGTFVNVPAEGTPGATGITWNPVSGQSGEYTASWTTTASPVTFENQLIVGETYTLKEESAPEGYRLDSTEVTFKLADDGTIVSTNGTSWPVNGRVTLEDGKALTMTNEKIHFSVVKLGRKTPGSDQPDASDETTPVAGAKLKICENVNGAPGAVASVAGQELSWTTTVTAGQADPKEIQGLPAGTYWLVEDQAPIDYLTAAPVEFEVDAEGKLTLATENRKNASLGGSNNLTLTLTDETFRGAVELTKSGKKKGTTEAVALEGVTFELYRQTGTSPDPGVDEKIPNPGTPDTTEDSASGDPTDDAPQYLFTTDTDGKIVVENLRGGHYYFMEKDLGSNEGYYLPKGPVGSFEVTEENSGTDNSAPIEVTIVNSDFVTYVNLTKVDAEEESQLLAGAVFTLSKQEADGAYQTVSTRTTGDDGKFEQPIEILDSGTYQLTETAAPYGYTLGTHPYEASFTIPSGAAQDALDGVTLDLSTASGRVWKDDKDVSGELLGRYGLTIADSFSQESQTGIRNGHDTGTVTLQKTDEEGRALTGITFTLYKKGESTSLGEFLTGNKYGYAADGSSTNDAASDGVLTISGLPWGDYYLQETKADGYELDAKEYAFTIGSRTDSEATTTPVGESGTWYQTSGMQINLGAITNKKSRITIKKGLSTDEENMAGVAGAKFSLEGNFVGTHEGEEGWEAIGDGSAKNYRFSWTSQAAPQGFDGLLKAGESYTLTEYATAESAAVIPQGALPLQADAVFTVTIGADGKVADVTGAPGNPDAVTIEKAADGLSITVKDEPTRLRVYKKGTDTETDPNGDPLLKECTFEVEPVNGSVFAPARTQTRDGAPEKIQVTTTGNTDGENELTGRLVIGGTYRITEITPPIGYELGIGMMFTVTAVQNESGRYVTTITPDASAAGSNYVVTYGADGSPIITQRDHPISAWIRKMDSSKTKGLNGAVFTIQGLTGQDKVAEENGTETVGPVEFTSGTVTDSGDGKTDGILDISKRLQESNELEQHIYLLTETKAPGGYTQMQKPIYFMLKSVWVDANNKILADAADGSKPAGGVMRKSVFDVLFKDEVSQEMQAAEQYTPDEYKDALDEGENQPGEAVTDPLVLTITNKQSYNPPSTTWHTVTKSWNDNNNAQGKRLDSVEMKLQRKTADGTYEDVAGQTAQILNEGNHWSGTWTGLSYGWEYRAVEVTDLTGTGYTSSASTSGTNTVITNTYTEETETPTPTPTVTPTPSGTPDPTDKPEPSKKPTPTDKPNPSGTPEPTGKPDSSVTPTVTARPSTRPTTTVRPSGNTFTRPGTTWSKNSTTSSDAAKADNAKTGDNTEIWRILLLMALSASVLLLAALQLRKKKH
ncbi:MAG: SpaA isopeptide-forming pilin-related protein [Blautia sp.]|jgi:uncharacterized surface anchored protein